MTFVARYPGRCGICQEVIHEGDEVVYVEGELAHADCADENPDEES